jgi:hypothetical protein
LGIVATSAANFAPDKIQAVYQMTGGKVARMRAQRGSGETVRNEFTDEERKKMNMRPLLSFRRCAPTPVR